MSGLLGASALNQVSALTAFINRYKSPNLLDPSKALLNTKPDTTTGASPDSTVLQNGYNTLGYVSNSGSNTYVLSLPGASSTLYVRFAMYLPSGYSTNITPSYSNGVFTVSVGPGYVGFRPFVDGSYTNFANSDLMLSSNWTGIHEPFGLEIATSNLSSSLLKAINPLYGKKIAWFGDSITDANNKTWAYQIPIDNSMTSTNYAVSGSSISYIPASVGTTTTETNCITKAIETYAANLVGYDYIIFSGGYNDGARGSTYTNGTLTAANDFTGALSLDTFYGALEHCCRTLLKTCLGSKVGFIITPNNPDNTSFRDNKYPAIKATLEKYSIPYIDLYKAGGLTPGIPEVNQGYFKDDNADGVSDKTHPTQTAYTTYLNDKVTRWLRNL